MRGIRDVLLSPTFARRAVVSVLAAVAVIVGLLAMHTLNLHNDDAGLIVATSAAVEHPAAEPQSSAHTDCDGVCASSMPMHDIMTMTMACVLALLVLVLVAGVPLMLRSVGPPRGWAAISHLVATAITPQPPSLSVLSIRRT